MAANRSCDARTAVWHPRPAEASPGGVGTAVSEHSPRCRDQSVASKLCRQRPTCTWGLVVGTGSVNLPTKARVCNNQGSQAILVPPCNFTGTPRKSLQTICRSGVPSA